MENARPDSREPAPPQNWREYYRNLHRQERWWQAAFNDLVRDLESRQMPETRAAAARSLRQDGSPAVEPLCRALGDPDPEVRRALPDLKAVAADSIHHGRETRWASEEIAHRIEGLTDRLQALPLPAQAPAPDPTSLPRPSEGSPTDSTALPRVRA